MRVQASPVDITLFVLVGSSTREQAGFTSFRLPDQTVVARAEAKAFLQRCSPPLFCARRAEGRALSIEVRPIVEAELEPHFDHAEHQFGFFQTQIQLLSGRTCEIDSTAPLALISPQGTLSITLAGLRAWFRDYFIPNRTLSIGKATSPILEGAIAVIRVGPGGTVSIQQPR